MSGHWCPRCPLHLFYPHTLQPDWPRAFEERAMKLQWVQFRLKADPSPGALDLGHLLNRGNNQRKEEATSTLLLSWQRLTKPSEFTLETSRIFRSASGDFLPDPVGGLGTPSAPFWREGEWAWGWNALCLFQHKNVLLAFSETSKWCGMCGLHLYFNVSNNLVLN